MRKAVVKKTNKVETRGKKPMLDKNKRSVAIGCKLTPAEGKKFNAYAKKDKARKNEILRGLLLKAGLI